MDFTPEQFADANTQQADLCRDFFAAIARQDGDDAKAALCESQADAFDAAASFWADIAAAGE